MPEPAQTPLPQTVDGKSSQIDSGADATTGHEAGQPQDPVPAPAPGGPSRYQLDHIHATGGIGRVWLARDRDLGREVALKELRPDRAHLPSAQARFLAEARITGQLEHPGIVPVYELVGNAEHGPCYAMRFVGGQTLAEAVRRYHDNRGRGQASRLELRALLGAFVGVCQAVAYAHSKGVIHRDLKPSNELLGDFGEAVVLDWGLAKRLGDKEESIGPEEVARESTVLTMAGSVLGTPAYMSAEQAEGQTDLIDQRSDVYGLGAILYEILTGRAPYVGADTKGLLQQVRAGSLAPPRQIVPETPAALESVCLKAMAHARERRYVSAGELADEVQRWLADEPIQAHRDPFLARAARWTRRHQALAAGVAAVLVSITVALGVGLALLRNEQQKTERQRLAAVAQREKAQLNEQAARLAEQNAQSKAAEAQAARALADQNARAVARQRQLALGTLQILVTTVQEQLQNKPDTHELKQDLLHSALVGLEKVAAGAGDATADLSTAEAHQRMGDIFLVLGQMDKAEKQFDLARAISQRVLEGDARNRAARRQLAAARRRLGKLTAETGALPKARKVLLQAHSGLRTVLGEDESDERAREELVETAMDLGDVSEGLGEAALFRDYYREAHQVAERGLEKSADKNRFKLLEALARAGLADATLVLGEVKSAGKHASKALDGLEALVKSGQKGGRLDRSLAWALYVHGSVLMRQGRMKAAREALKRSLEVAERVARADPKNVTHQRFWSVALNQMGDAVLEMGQPTRAREYFEKSLDVIRRVVERRKGPRDRQDLALAYMRLGTALEAQGRYVEARTAVERAPSLFGPALAADKKNLDARRNLAHAYRLLGQIAERLNDSAQARQHYETFVKSAEELTAADPKHTRYQTDLLIAYNKLGDLLAHIGAAEEALALYQKSLARALAVKSIDKSLYQKSLARALAVKSIDKGRVREEVSGVAGGGDQGRLQGRGTAHRRQRSGVDSRRGGLPQVGGEARPEGALNRPSAEDRNATEGVPYNGHRCRRAERHGGRSLQAPAKPLEGTPRCTFAALHRFCRCRTSTGQHTFSGVPLPHGTPRRAFPTTSSFRVFRVLRGGPSFFPVAGLIA
jgi:tetratricopeptide (TPR) repeat protein/tRNA A-37 threonylcarbamoyl transferase component Bud32